MAVLYTNKATSTLLSAITSADTTITVASGHGSRFPAPSNDNYFFVTVEDFSTGATEVMKVTARFGDSMTVERGFDFTTAAAFNAGVTVELRVSAAMLDAIKRDAISDVPLTDGTGAFGNWDINVLGTAKKWEKARLFRVGNADRYVDGSGNVEWALADIGALPLTGGTLTTTGSTATLEIVDTGTNGANIRLTGNGGATPNKTIRAFNGDFEIINSGYTAVLLTVRESGNLDLFARGTATYQGYSVSAKTASASAYRGVYYDVKNENEIPVANCLCDVNTDGSSSWYWSVTAAGARTSDRRVDAMRLDSGRNLIVNQNVTAYSDERLKAEWADLPADFIERLAEVRHGTYTRIDSGARQIGVSAQSLQSVAPEGVLAGEYLSVAYGNVALAAAVQLSRRVLELERRLSKLIEE